MMISPAIYKEQIEKLCLGELLKERNKIIRDIRRFEKTKDMDSFEIIMNPSPAVVYQCNNDYLVEVTKVINEKFNIEHNK
ncbi:MAG: hypothetical protein PHI05_04980 [Bacilli bacterium]|nr:hypothetical protein [Bacilli bacterium]